MKTILVADDEFDILNSIKVVLEDEGFKVLTAANGKEALALVEEARPNLLITDSVMPHLTGYELLEKLANTKNQPPSIVMCNVKPDSNITRRTDAILMKPFTLEQLITTVKRVMKN